MVTSEPNSGSVGESPTPVDTVPEPGGGEDPAPRSREASTMHCILWADCMHFTDFSASPPLLREISILRSEDALYIAVGESVDGLHAGTRCLLAVCATVAKR